MDHAQNLPGFSPPLPEDPHSIKQRMMPLQLSSRPEAIAKMISEIRSSVSTASSGKLAAINSNLWGDDQEDKEFLEHLKESSEDDCLRIARDAIEWTANSKAIGEIPEDKQVDTTFEDLTKIAVERRAMVKEMLDEVLEVLDEGEELSEADIEYLAKATGMEEEGIKSWLQGGGDGSEEREARKYIGSKETHSETRQRWQAKRN
ncbi:hypothetical protein FPQ18DRAFT_380806 [Pyronema domesticum]|nr:hypothetical protein FPQ18DRAFT_380806 [Pyronema domesticum]